MCFTLESALQFRVSFLRSLLFCFLGSVIIFSGTKSSKFAGTSSPYSPWLTRFAVVKMFKAQWGRDRNMDTIMEISVAHRQPPFPYSENQYKLKQQHSCPVCWLALSRVANTHQPVWLPNYYTNMISSSVLSLASFIFHHRLLNTL